MNNLFVIGFGSGNIDDLTLKAYSRIINSDLVFCDEKAFLKLEKQMNTDNFIPNEYSKTDERCDNAISHALKNKNVSILGSGDAGIYGIAGIILEKTEFLDINVEIIPGITSALSGAALLGAPLAKDFVVISLSDNFSNFQEITAKINFAIENDLVIVFYSPAFNDNFPKIIDILKMNIDSGYVGLVSNIGEVNQDVSIFEIAEFKENMVQKNSTIFISNSSTKKVKNYLINPLVK